MVIQLEPTQYKIISRKCTSFKIIHFSFRQSKSRPYLSTNNIYSLYITLFNGESNIFFLLTKHRLLLAITICILYGTLKLLFLRQWIFGMPLIKENICLIFLITPHRIRTAIGKYQFHPCATRTNVAYCIRAFFCTMNICNSIWFKEVSRPLPT